MSCKQNGSVKTTRNEEPVQKVIRVITNKRTWKKTGAMLICETSDHRFETDDLGELGKHYDSHER